MGNTTGKYVFDYATVWTEMEKLVRPVNGTRFIGLSNHSPDQVSSILANATIKPRFHQFELHPYLQQQDWVQQNFKHGITVTGYAPLSNTNPVHNLAVSDKASNSAPIIVNTPTVKKIAEARGCSPAQVVLAWNLARNVVVIPKAARVEHQKENIATLEKCKLTETDVKEVNALNIPLRLYQNACGYGLTEGCAQK
jgi:alcohol dehydrogenase (NADP+)